MTTPTNSPTEQSAKNAHSNSLEFEAIKTNSPEDELEAKVLSIMEHVQRSLAPEAGMELVMTLIQSERQQADTLALREKELEILRRVTAYSNAMHKEYMSQLEAAIVQLTSKEEKEDE
ncbi:hypothetical protein [Pseudarthrobacter sp. H2]|uniref:hypothetical protein n=1 Tax=Pseudarthrobacter sp. H2 TaxID=3418415 RepID=UPI003CF6179D